MGTEITLSIGGIDVDYAKNCGGDSHGALFKELNRTRVHCESIDYDATPSEDFNIAAYEMAFVRPLSEILPRLEMMGFGLDDVCFEYNQACKYYLDELAELQLEKPLIEVLTFEEFRQFVKEHPLTALDDHYIDSNEHDLTGRNAKGRFNLHPAVIRLPHYEFNFFNFDPYSERDYFSRLIGFLSPYSRLRILAESPDNLDLDVIWQYGPIVENGWGRIEEFEPGVSRLSSVLIATEGSTDVNIIRKALTILKPEIADFFAFTDTSNHPQNGTQGLLMLAKALCHVDVSNTVLLLFDNDAEGCDARNEVNKLTLPPGVRAITLPDLKEFESFPCIGPDGRTLSNINGRAAAIECYLDLNFGGLPEAYITWKDRKRSNTYHGALEFKETYSKIFFNQSPHSINTNGYNMSKLAALIDHIVAESRFVTSLNK